MDYKRFNEVDAIRQRPHAQMTNGLGAVHEGVRERIAIDTDSTRSNYDTSADSTA